MKGQRWSHEGILSTDRTGSSLQPLVHCPILLSFSLFTYSVIWVERSVRVIHIVGSSLSLLAHAGMRVLIFKPPLIPQKLLFDHCVFQSFSDTTLFRSSELKQDLPISTDILLWPTLPFSVSATQAPSAVTTWNAHSVSTDSKL